MSGSDIAISLFDKMRREDICREPFPHIVVDNVFPEDFANRLLLSMPEFNSIKQEIHCTSYRLKKMASPSMVLNLFLILFPLRRKRT